MLEVSIDDIINGDWAELDPDDLPYCIYVVRENETVFYVGKSERSLNRLEEHFSPSSRRSSGGAIGKFYRQHIEESHRWKIRLYTLEDCQPYIQHLPAPKRQLLSYVEIAMIQHFRPCLNVKNNPNPSRLPDKYLTIDLDNNAVDYIHL